MDIYLLVRCLQKPFGFKINKNNNIKNNKNNNNFKNNNNNNYLPAEGIAERMPRN